MAADRQANPAAEPAGERRQGTLLLDGRRVAEAVQAAVRAEVAQVTGPVPCLAVVQVGDDPASTVYIRNKRRMAEAVGMRSRHCHLPGTSSQAEVVEAVARLSADPDVDGVLVQLPLPPGIAAEAVLEAVDADKDVDGLKPENLGRLAVGRPRAIPCTPKGIMRLLEFYRIDVAGRRAVVLGRSRLVGLPLALLLLQADATVTVAHSKSGEVRELTRQADVVVAAVGRAHLLDAEWIRPGAVVVDVGINRIEDPLHPKGARLVGDVDWEALLGRAAALTPVPGGVGPMTVAMLIENTWEAYRRRRGGGG